MAQSPGEPATGDALMALEPRGECRSSRPWVNEGREAPGSAGVQAEPVAEADRELAARLVPIPRRRSPFGRLTESAGPESVNGARRRGPAQRPEAARLGQGRGPRRSPEVDGVAEAYENLRIVCIARARWRPSGRPACSLFARLSRHPPEPPPRPLCRRSLPPNPPRRHCRGPAVPRVAKHARSRDRTEPELSSLPWPPRTVADSVAVTRDPFPVNTPPPPRLLPPDRCRPRSTYPKKRRT